MDCYEIILDNSKKCNNDSAFLMLKAMDNCVILENGVVAPIFEYSKFGV